jgi:hypothetical protein
VKPEIVPYDTAWPERYEEEAARLAEALDRTASRIDYSEAKSDFIWAAEREGTSRESGRVRRRP